MAPLVPRAWTPMHGGVSAQVTRARRGISARHLHQLLSGFVPHMCIPHLSLHPWPVVSSHSTNTQVFAQSALGTQCTAPLPKLYFPSYNQDATGCQQMCGGQICGIEAAVHAARQAFNSEKCEAALLFDASNAFNSLNRQTTLQNIRRLCPLIANILVNTYRAPTELFGDNDVILSREGTTQGDLLAMAMYGLATIPLIQKLNGPCKQVWYADDSVVFGSLEHLRSWWDRLTREGPHFGYFANPSKVTKDRHIHNAAKIFAGSAVNITSHGRPYLRAPLGSSEFIESVPRLANAQAVSPSSVRLQYLNPMLHTQL